MSGKKYSVSVGINDYPGTNNDLRGCVNDAVSWHNLLTGAGYEAQLLLDATATKKNVVTELTRMVALAKWGDTIVFTDSSHGSWVPDTSGDEADGRDECIVLYDFQNGGYLIDDEIYEIFGSRRTGVKAMIFSDSCHSGSLTREFHMVISKESLRLPRFLPPGSFLAPEQLQAAKKVQGVKAKSVSRLGAALISGCGDDEYSYDAVISGVPRGAFSEAALRTYTPGIRLGDWYKKIRAILPSGEYPQSPQLTASFWQKRYVL